MQSLQAFCIFERMIRNFILIYFVVVNCTCLAQKNDNTWPLASIYFPPGNLFYKLDFANGNPDTVVYQRKMLFFITNAAVSDSSGSLQFYSNGIWIANKLEDTLFNSQNFNNGYSTSSHINSGLGITQAIIFLTVNHTNLIHYVIHESAESFLNQDSANDVQPLDLRYSVIDMSLDSGNGGIVSGLKDIRPLQDTLLFGRITATKHANGRDWWVVTHKYYSDIYYTLLFTPYGVYGPYSQQIGPVLYPKFGNNYDYDIYGMSSFAYDGSKYAMIGVNNVLHLMDFDRCSGLFSNHQSIQVNDTVSAGLGCSFSPNSRYLYVNTYLKAFQFDTYSTNISATETLVASYDGFMDPLETWFFLNQQGPDGKIYVSTANFSRSIHVIENPDSAGIACSFNQHSLILPYLGGTMGIPNFPNYRLGRLVGSPCDTLTAVSDAQPPAINLKTNPNPNDGNFIINYELPQNKSGTLEIMDIMSKVVYKQTLPQWSVMQRLNLEKLTAGVYVVKLSSDNKNSFSRFVKN